MLSHSLMFLASASFLVSGVKLGLIFCIMTLGVHISFRILDAADLSIEGVFPLGACICALLIYFGVPAIIATIIAFIAGILGGLLTGVLHTKLKIPMILSGIITMTALYSINLLILGFSNESGGSITRASLMIANKSNIFYGLIKLLISWGVKGSLANTLSTILVSGICFGVVYILIYYFFGTELGMSIRATGDNERMAKAQGINTDWMKILGLMISNGLIALAGALFAQNTGVANVTSGRGMIVIGLASIIIGEVIFGRKSYKKQLISIIIGTIIYFILRQIAIELKLSELLDLASAILIVIILSLPLIKKKIIHKKALKGDKDA